MEAIHKNLVLQTVLAADALDQQDDDEE